MQGRSREEFIEYVSTMELQNLSGREDFQEAFEIGIGAAYDEFVENEKITLPKSPKTCKDEV